MTDPSHDLQTLPQSRLLTAAAFQKLADVAPELEWFANISNKSTRRAYENALQDFMRFTGISEPGEFRLVSRSHVIAWRDDLVARPLSGMTVRHRLAALSSLFEHLCESNAITHNPVKGVKRPPVEGYEGKTPALGDHQARQLLDAPEGVSVKGKRDRAILAAIARVFCFIARQRFMTDDGGPFQRIPTTIALRAATQARPPTRRSRFRQRTG